VKILVDENIPRMTVEHLREAGHNVVDIRGTAGQGLTDADLWISALREGCLLITTDKGSTQYRGADHFGILVIRLQQPNRLKIHNSVLLALQRFTDSDWPRLLVVMRDATMSTSRAGGPVTR
jgi:predicted nuclease of predicted toxin-antitoxin system